MRARGLVLTAPHELTWQALDLVEPKSGEVCVRVAGCGLCHTDVGFFDGTVRPRHPLPLVLGHEIAGTVEVAPPPFEHLLHRDVIVPAVIPCGSCELCRAGRDNACVAQIMPGNDVHGGFATHAVLPARDLVVLGPKRAGYSLAELSVVADAVTTPYQALTRANVAEGDLAVVIGIGGIGTYAVQIAVALGARVAAIDVDEEKLARAAALGADWCFSARGADARSIKRQLQQGSGVPTPRWRIFEMSGTVAGQELAWALLAPAATLGVIGFTMERPAIRLSNLMALDATAFGSWGCSPSLYPAALDLVLSGRVDLRPFIETYPFGRAPELFAQAADAHAGAPARRPIVVPS